jgi:hypothetical protein
MKLLEIIEIIITDNIINKLTISKPKILSPCKNNINCAILKVILIKSFILIVHFCKNSYNSPLHAYSITKEYGSSAYK